VADLLIQRTVEMLQLRRPDEQDIKNERQQRKYRQQGREQRQKKAEGNTVSPRKKIVAHHLVIHEDDHIVNRDAVKADEGIFFGVPFYPHPNGVLEEVVRNVRNGR
jgi:hypothetical protein